MEPATFPQHEAVTLEGVQGQLGFGTLCVSKDSVPGKSGRVPGLGDWDHQPEEDPGSSGRRPLCLLSGWSCQVRAEGLRTDTWVGCLCSI